MDECMRTIFENRAELVSYLQKQFPDVIKRGTEVSPTHGGRKAAEQQLQQIQLERYTTTRNMLHGSVTHLSPYIRHGVLSLAEVKAYAKKHAGSDKTRKFVQELAWRDYYQRVYERLGDQIWLDIEPYKTHGQMYENNLPQEIEQGQTGLACIDSFAQDLKQTGYLHNHARLWTAAYVVHHRHIRWQAGAHWFLRHLLDGDPASNNLSWQWVASTFSTKPYIFNRDNLAHYTANQYCTTCPLRDSGCPFAASYEQLQTQLFPPQKRDQQAPDTQQIELEQKLRVEKESLTIAEDKAIDPANDATVIWINEDNLNPQGPALSAIPQADPLFIFDQEAINQAQWTLKKLVFIYECLIEIPRIRIYKGSPTEILTREIQQQQTQLGRAITIATTETVDPRLQQVIATMKQTTQVSIYHIEAFVTIEKALDLGRFSRYWRTAEHAIDEC